MSPQNRGIGILVHSQHDLTLTDLEAVLIYGHHAGFQPAALFDVALAVEREQNNITLSCIRTGVSETRSSQGVATLKAQLSIPCLLIQLKILHEWRHRLDISVPTPPF